MIRQIAPQFFSADIPSTLAYYKEKLGFECLGTWQDPLVYAIVARDQHAIHFRCGEPPTANRDKYEAIGMGAASGTGKSAGIGKLHHAGVPPHRATHQNQRKLDTSKTLD